MRGIKKDNVETVIVGSKRRFADVEHDAKVAVGPLNGRSLVVIYRVVNSDIRVIALYHTRKVDKLISSKTKRGAWRQT